MYCHLERKGKVNSDEEKRYNRKHSKLRIIVEHTISRIKKFGIIGTKFRNKLGRYDHASDIVSGLVNFRIILEHPKQIFFHNYAIGLFTKCMWYCGL
jgi:hypothetical protein